MKLDSTNKMEVAKTQGGANLAVSNIPAIKSIRHGNEIATAIQNGIALKDQPNDENMRGALRYVFVLMGLKETSFPGDIEKQVLFENIMKYYGNITPEEIKLAYQMALNGELIDTAQRKPIDVRLYGDVYSYEHFSMVMKSYVEQKRREIMAVINKKANQPVEPTEEQKAKDHGNFINNCIIFPIEQSIKNKSKIDFGNVNPRDIYKRMVKAELISLEKQEIEKIKKRHIEEVKTDWKRKSESAAATPEQYELKKIIKKAIDGTDVEPFLAEVLRRCYMEAIELAISLNDIETIKSNLLKNA